MNREDFPMLEKDIIYFDNAATSLKPNTVIKKTTEYYSEYCANAHRGDYDISYKVTKELEDTREEVRKFINAEKLEEVIFTSGTTESLNMVAKGFFENILDETDEILITKSEHASNVLPWFRLSNKLGCHIKYVELDDNGYVTIENVKRAISPNTKVIALAHVTNVLGDIRPIKEICKLAHENNIFVVVDGAQSVPHFKTDVRDLDVDFLAFSAHKMLGPTGVGILYGKYELLNNLEPVYLGGGMNESFDNENEVYLHELPLRLEAGTVNIAGILGFGEAIKYLNNVGMDNIECSERNLRKYFVDELVKIPHIDILDIEGDAAIVSFNVDGIFSQDVAYYLNKYGICVRAGNHCAKLLKDQVKVTNSVRASLYFYNTESEIDEFVSLLKDKDKILKEML